MTTIRRRLTLWYTVALGVTLLAFGALLYLEQRQSGLRDLDQRLNLEAGLVERWLADLYRSRGKVTTVTADGRRTLDPDVSVDLDSFRDHVIVADSAGNVLALSDATRSLTYSAQRRLLMLLNASSDTRRWGTASLGFAFSPVRYLVVHIRTVGREVGTVLIATPLAQAAFGPAGLLRSMLLIAPLVMASALVLGYWLAGTSLRPLQVVTDEVEAITDGRSLHRRLAPLMSGDELSRLVVTLNGMLARLERSFVSLHRFTAEASHELKTPLMVIRAGVERTLTNPGLPPEALQYLDESLAQINRMSEMVDSLLTLARADEGRAPLALEECDLRELLTDAAETAGILGDEAGVMVTAELPDHEVKLAVDRHRIREMLLNLVTNAVKYTPSGGTVGLALEDSGPNAVLIIRDTGIGIAPGDLPYIFDRFWRADSARSRTGDRPGTGLGLAITKWIAEAHRGSIGVQSRPGRGTTFTVTLPKAPRVLINS